MVLLFATSILLSCDGGGGSSSDGGGTGTVSVSLTDSTADEYLAVYITINGIQIRTSDDGSSSIDDPSNDVSSDNNSSDDDSKWESLEPPDGVQFPKTYNLLKLINGVTEAIGSGEFSAGTYHQVRLMIGDSPELENNLLGEPHPEANYLILNDGSDTIRPIKIPSGFQTGIKLVRSFTVSAGEIKELVLDFDASRSVVKAGDSGKHLLKPTIKVIDQENKIDVYGSVTDVTDNLVDPILLGGITVSAQISDGLSAIVVRSTMTSDVDDPENGVAIGDYVLSLISPDQIYNIVAYSDVKVEINTNGSVSERLYSPECASFQYNNPDDKLPLNFELTANNDGIGTISGKVEVKIDGEIEEDFPLVITIYTDLDCSHPDSEGYVELTKVSDITFNGNNIFEYQIDLQLYESEVTYYVVASAEAFIPATDSAILNTDNLEATEVNLTLIQAE
jgi:hypothetical protein